MAKKRKTKARPETKRKDVPRVPGFKTSFWMWFAGATAAFTLFSGLQTILELGNWAHWLVANWQFLTESVWRQPFRLVGREFVPEAAAPLTLVIALFTICLGGLALESRYQPKPQPKASFWKVILGDDLPMRFAEGIAIATCSMLVFRASLERLLS